MQTILFLSFLSPYVHRIMLTRFRWLKYNSIADQDSKMSLHKCYSKCCLHVLKISLKSYSNTQVLRQKISYSGFLSPRSVGKIPRTIRKLHRMKSHRDGHAHPHAIRVPGSI